MKFRDLTGQRFERLIAAEPLRRAGSKIAWVCQCDCGKMVTVTRDNLVSGHTKSCGCLSREMLSERARERNFRHGHNLTGRQSPTHKSWSSMIQRCRNPRNTSFADYGGRGITVCESWASSFENFLADMGPRPERKTLDRIDPNKGYGPGNCRWATKSEQQRNKRDKTNPRGLAAFRRQFPNCNYSDVHIRRMLRTGLSFKQIASQQSGGAQ